jgi:hypothetical protein
MTQPTVTRAEWSARQPASRTFLVKVQQRGTAIHYSGSDADEQSQHNNCAARVRSIQRFHMDGRGWADIAYSFLVCKHGYIFTGRGVGVRTAANGTDAGNTAFHAVCFLGDDSAGRDDITDAGRRALRQAVESCNRWAGKQEVRPHSFFKPTGCPGDQLRAWIIQGLPVVKKQEDELTEAEKQWILQQLDNTARRIVRWLDHNDPDTLGNDYPHKRLREAIGNAETRLAAIEQQLAAIEQQLAGGVTSE